MSVELVERESPELRRASPADQWFAFERQRLSFREIWAHGRTWSALGTSCMKVVGARPPRVSIFPHTSGILRLDQSDLQPRVRNVLADLVAQLEDQGFSLEFIYRPDVRFPGLNRVHAALLSRDERVLASVATNVHGTSDDAPHFTQICLWSRTSAGRLLCTSDAPDLATSPARIESVSIKLPVPELLRHHRGRIETPEGDPFREGDALVPYAREAIEDEAIRIERDYNEHLLERGVLRLATPSEVESCKTELPAVVRLLNSVLLIAGSILLKMVRCGVG